MSLTCPRCLTSIPSDGPVVYVGAEERVLHRSCYERRGTKAELGNAPAGPGVQAPRCATDAAGEEEGPRPEQ